MREEIQKWAEPMVKIREKYRGEIAKVLRPEQKAKMESSLETLREHREERRGPGGPGNLMAVVLIAPQLDRITQHLVLDDAQKKQVEAVLKKQREEILAWLDANPAPKPPGRPDRALGHREPGMAEGFASHRPFPPGPPQRP
jgi:Spy/CpxP family protein refolding chaperone